MTGTTTPSRDRAKQAAAEAALDRYVRDGMRLGLGSGSTARLMVKALAERIRGGLSVVGVATSTATRDLALAEGVPLADLNDLGRLDLTLDGADEVDVRLAMIKGGGASLLWEKIVATASDRMVAMVEPGKVVDTLGRFPLPVEVVRFGWRATQRLVEEVLRSSDVGGTCTELRQGPDGPVITDSGHVLLDCHLERIGDPESLAAQLTRVPGVVETGLFIGIATAAVIGRPDGSVAVIGGD